VGPDNMAEFREVRLGALIDGMRVVQSGLKPGELVVVNGLQRVRPGAPVAPQRLDVDERGMPVEKPAAPPAGAASGAGEKKPEGGKAAEKKTARAGLPAAAALRLVCTGLAGRAA